MPVSVDWAYLFEPYARPANELIFDRLGMRSSGLRLLDIACGSGFAVSSRTGGGLGLGTGCIRGAWCAIATHEDTNGDFRVGTCSRSRSPMTVFDSATSFNGIWKGAKGVVASPPRPCARGRLGLTFWGRYDHLGLMPYFRKSSSSRLRARRSQHGAG